MRNLFYKIYVVYVYVYSQEVSIKPETFNFITAYDSLETKLDDISLDPACGGGRERVINYYNLLYCLQSLQFIRRLLFIARKPCVFYTTNGTETKFARIY